MTELELRQMFKNRSDCYADTGWFENDGSYTEGEVIQAMTEDRFIEALKEAKLLPIPAVVGRSEQLLAVAEYVYNHFDDSSSKTAKDYLQDFLSQ
jgi:hypothetical protein